MITTIFTCSVCKDRFLVMNPPGAAYTCDKCKKKTG